MLISAARCGRQVQVACAVTCAALIHSRHFTLPRTEQRRATNR